MPSKLTIHSLLRKKPVSSWQCSRHTIKQSITTGVDAVVTELFSSRSDYYDDLFKTILTSQLAQHIISVNSCEKK